MPLVLQSATPLRCLVVTPVGHVTCCAGAVRAVPHYPRVLHLLSLHDDGTYGPGLGVVSCLLFGVASQLARHAADSDTLSSTAQVALRRVWTSHTYLSAPRSAQLLQSAIVVAGLAYFTAFMETWTISSVRSTRPPPTRCRCRDWLLLEMVMMPSLYAW